MNTITQLNYKLPCYEGPLDLLLTLIAKNKVNIYKDDRVYQLKGSKRFNALKYVQIYYRYKNISKGDFDGKFLGL